MFLPEEILKTIVFLGKSTEVDGFLNIDVRGTGFLVCKPKPNSQTLGSVFLVTAKHVALKLAGSEFSVMMNKRGSGVGGMRISNGLLWTYHDDPSIDVAVMAMDQKLLEFDVRWLAMSEILTQRSVDDGQIHVGDEVSIVGLFSKMPGKTRILPVARTGSVAMLPNEKVPTKLGEIEAYIIEARSSGGLSGSPVFVRSGVAVPTQAGTFFGAGGAFLMGLAHGHWDIPAGEDETKSVNMGLAIVVPAKLILDVIEKCAAKVM